MVWSASSVSECLRATASRWDVVTLQETLFLTGDALTTLVTDCGQYAAAGVGLSVVFWAVGYVVWFLVDFAKGVL